MVARTYPEKKPGPRKRARPGRPPTIDSEQLLNAARAVFLERGIRATTLEVAERAGVSEGAIFHRFKSKDRLFGEAMRLQREDVPELMLQKLEAVEGMALEPALVQLATGLLEVGRVALPLMMMSWSNPNLCGATPCDKNRNSYHAFVKRLGGYFEAQAEAGRLRRMDAEVIARVFLGSVHHYCMVRVMFEDDRSAVLPEGMFVRGLVDLLLQGALTAADRSGAPAIDPVSSGRLDLPEKL
jgi:AcrR family transcriptional regulator